MTLTRPVSAPCRRLGDQRAAVIDARTQALVARGGHGMPRLLRCGAAMGLAVHRQLAGGRRQRNAAATAVVARPLASLEAAVADGAALEDGVHTHRPEIVVGPVVEKCTAAPVAAVVATAEVAEPIVNAAVETNGRTPVTGMEQVDAAVPAPPGRCPEKIERRWGDPGAPDPVVVVQSRVPAPVSLGSRDRHRRGSEAASQVGSGGGGVAPTRTGPPKAGYGNRRPTVAFDLADRRNGGGRQPPGSRRSRRPVSGPFQTRRRLRSRIISDSRCSDADGELRHCAAICSRNPERGRAHRRSDPVHQRALPSRASQAKAAFIVCNGRTSRAASISAAIARAAASAPAVVV